MVETPNYSNSPLANPNFFKAPATPVGNFVTSKLADPRFQAEIVANEPAPLTLEEERAKLEAEANALSSRSADEIIGDFLISGVNAAASGLLAIGGLATKGIGAGVEAVAPEDSIVSDIAGIMNDRAMVSTAETMRSVSDFTNQGKSDTAVRSAEIQGELSQIDNVLNQQQYEQDIAAGDSEFIASLSLYGRQALDFADRISSDPVAAGDLVANAMGSLSSGSVLAGLGSKLSTAIASRFGVEGTKRVAAEYAGSAFGMGVTEASSVYTSTIDEVMGRSLEEMESSQLFNDLVANGMDPITAQMQVADEAGLDAFVSQLPTAMAAGLLSAKFNANPIGAMKGENPLEFFASVGKETLEEGIQGATGQYSQNNAIKDIVDPAQDLSEGVVDQGLGGIFGGFAAGGLVSAPSGLSNAIKASENREIAEREATAQRRVNALQSMSPEERDTFLRSEMNQTSIGEELFNSVMGKTRDFVTGVKETATGFASSNAFSGAVDTVKASVQAAKEAVTPVINAAIKAGQNYTEQGNPVVQNETIAAADSVSAVVRSMTDTETVKSLVSPDESIKTETLPEVFRDNVSAGSNLADTMSGIVKTLAEKRVPISEMKDDAVLFVAQKYSEMQNAASTLPADIQAGIKKVLASPDLERIRKRAARLDLNTAVSSIVEKVSSTLKSMTVAMSKLNPSNVNPDIVDKILKQDDRTDLTPQDIQSMTVAASVARPLNTYKENLVQISDEKSAALKVKNPDARVAENNVEQVSRNFLTRNFPNSTGVSSVSETANQIILGMQSPDQSIEVGDTRVPVKQVASNFRLLAQHMINKVNALNESFDGEGRTVMFDTLVRGKDFIKAGMAGAGSVYYRVKSENSVALAKTIHADATVLAEVFNALVKAYPEQFPEGPVQIPVLRGTQVVEIKEETPAVSAPEGRRKGFKDLETEAQDVASEQENTTADEEVPPSGGTDEAQTNTNREQETFKGLLEDAMGRIEEGDPEVGMTINDDKVFEYASSQKDIKTRISGNTVYVNHADIPAYLAGGQSNTTAPEVESPLSTDEGPISDGNGNPLVFYHGTRNQFENFNSGEIFFTTQRGFAKGYAFDPNTKKVGRLVAANVTVSNPLVVNLPGNGDTDVHWLNNTVALRSEMKSGNHDAVLITNEEGDAMVIATEDSQITQIEDPVKDRTPGAKTEGRKVNERFNGVFRTKKSPVKFVDGQDIIDKISEKSGTKTYVQFAQVLMKQISDGMNARLGSVLFTAKDGRTALEVLKEGEINILEFTKFKPLTLVNPETSQYNEEMLSIASMAVIDWMTTARAYGADRFEDLLDDLGLNGIELSEQEISNLLNSVPTRSTSEALAKKIIKMWNLQPNLQSQMGDIRGITEGLVKEIITVVSQQEDPLIKLIEVPTKEGKAASFEISALAPEQAAIGLKASGSLDKVFFPEDQIQASFGQKLTHVPKSQNNKPDVGLTDMERSAIKNMQDTAHKPAAPVIEFFDALGLEAWSRMAGKKDSSKLAKRHPLRLSIEGKNVSIERDYITAFQMVEASEGQDVFYPVGVTDVGRHQMKGINPQNNKLLRALMTPTHAVLDMLNNQQHKDAFWLTVAQSSGLAKVEKKNHAKILKTIREDFMGRYRDAVTLAVEYLETETLNQEAFADAMVKAGKGEDVAVAQVNSVLAVARLIKAKRDGSLEKFETTLSFELDGKTDGPANMMVAFGQGIMTRLEYMNFKRVGLFLGSKSETLNSFMEQGNVDLYEVNSTIGTTAMVKMINEAKGMDKKRLMALQRFAGHFGDFEIKPDGSIAMSRATSKNPMTKKVYGSGEKGIAEGISQDMLVGFYTQLTSLTEGSVEDHLNYPEINQDLDLLFGVTLGDKLDVNQFILPAAKMAPFAEYVKKTIGTIISDSTKEVISDKTIAVNDLLVFITGVQAEFMKSFFDQRLAETLDEAKKEWLASGDPTSFSLRKLSQAAYDAVVRETMAFAPMYQDGLQNLRVGSFSGQQDKVELSSNMDGNIRAKSTMQRPDDLGVKVIPYVIQGRGDAMMMNRIFSAENAPEKAIPIFDGIDMAITDFMSLSNQINEAVLQNWDHDVLSPIMSNFDGFLDMIENQGLTETLAKAFVTQQKKSEEKTSVVVTSVNGLKEKLAEAVKLNQARKGVFKKITLSVDHMGGSGQSYVRNADGKELTFEEINQMIQDQVDGKVEITLPTEQITEPVQEVTEDTIVVTDVATVVDAVIRETKKKHIREAIRAIRDMLPDDAQIVMGTPEQIAQWRSENLDQNPIKKLDQSTKGYYDVVNNMIFIMSDNPETITHELIHMATFSAVLDHYTGVKKSNAVKNLEVLMEEFMAMDMSKAPEQALQAYNAAKVQILKAQAEATPMGSSVALNEFMAWTLSNESLMKELSQTPTSLVARLTKLAKVWIQRILGVVPLDMYQNILFNTEMIRNDEMPLGIEDAGNGGDNTNGNDSIEVTPPAQNFTNFWIDLLSKRLEESKVATGKEKQKQLLRYISTAEDALKKLDFGGFAMSEYQKKTFMAIHAVIAAELRLDSNALIALGKIYEHVTNNLTPAMFGTGQAAQDKYSTTMELMGATKNDQGISDAIAVLVALSQTSNGFRTTMDQIPKPADQPGINTSSLNDVLTSTAGFLMQKMIVSTDTEGKGVQEILNNLSDQILRQDDQKEFRALKTLMGTFDKADAFVGGALSLLAQRTRETNRDIQNSQRSAVLKTVSGSVALATGFLDKNLSKQSGKAVKTATHMDGMLDGAVFIRELVAEIVGADSINTDVIQMLDKVNYVVQSSRQAYREELPVILQNEFDEHPTADQWKDLHHVLGKGDFAALFDIKDPDASFDMLSDQSLLDQRVRDMEKKIRREFPGQMGTNILIKAQQLADFMNGKGAGFQLWKNAYAIHKLVGGKKPFMVSEIDKLVSLYALNGTDVAQRESVAQMQATDPKGVHNLLVYVQALNKEEDQKVISEAARMNGYKGYIPDQPKGQTSLIIARDADRENLEKRGYVRVSDDTTDSGSLVSRGYYMSTVKQSGNYSQGVLQQVQDTYRGVNATTGLTVTGATSGVISGVAVIAITDALNNVLTVNDNKNVLIPVMDQDGGVLYYERSLNPDLVQKYLQPESNMALMVGSWAGRQVEEKFSHEYNKALVQKLKDIWDNREPNTDGLFTRMDQDQSDKIYAESWKVIPPQLKEHIIGLFGQETGFMVRKDMINLALGYRDPSIVDVWTGDHRLSDAVSLAIKVAGKATMGDKAYTWLANAEDFIMGTVSSAKDLIVVRSLVVPLMNTQSNVFQLVNRGVGTKQIMKGYREKFVEIDKLNENLKTIMGLQARIRLAATDKNKVAILKHQIQVLEDENNRFTVAPLVAAGAYKNISEGITELDVELTKGRFGDWLESKINKLPTGVQTIAKYGMLSKDTALYKGANKAVQYGDFIAKSIYYDDLTAKGMTHEQAMEKVNEEFVNFSLLPGRTRTYLEGMGATWFLTFKIRSMKVALQMMRENPVRSLAMVNVLGVDSGPMTDNLIGKAVEGTLPYSLGWDMLWDAPSMNPWVAATGL